MLRAGAVGNLVRFAEAAAIPTLTAFRRYHAFPYDHPLYLGCMGLGAATTVKPRLAAADVLLALGTRLGEFTTGAYALPAPGTRLIHIDIDADVVGTNNATALGIVADAREAVRALHAALADAPDPRRAAREAANARDREAFRAAVALPDGGGGYGPDDGPVDAAGIVADLNRLLSPETIVTGDAGNHWSWFGRYFRFPQEGMYLGPTSGAMGYAMPAAVGAALARPGTPVLAVAGDGGFLMTGNELETAVRCQLPIIALVFNNCGYATIRMHQEREFPHRVSATDLGPVDFAGFARSLGAHGVRVIRNRDFAPALSAALAGRRPALIEVITDMQAINVGQTIACLHRGAEVPR